MELTVNHNLKIYPEGLATLQDLMNREAPGKTKGIAVAQNNRVIPQAAWSLTTVQPGDQILIIMAAQGG